MTSAVSFNWLIATIALVIHAKPIAIAPNAKISGISTDTRTLKTGDLFFALSGENFDGHRFVERAIAQGAVAVVVSETWFNDYKNIDNNSCTFLVVQDVLRAYQDLAHWWRSQCDVKIIAITGSAGKTEGDY
jgi:UDP-N-acetylmuramoyl-tripeptide--D-alanyl-D-alanine ligase